MKKKALVFGTAACAAVAASIVNLVRDPEQQPITATTKSSTTSALQVRDVDRETAAQPSAATKSTMAATGEDSTFANPASELPSTVTATVDWESAQHHIPLDREMLNETQAAKIDGADLPVLLPSVEGLTKSAVITTGPNWYAASMDQGDVTVLVSGTTEHLSTVKDQVAELPVFGDHNLSLQRSEGIVELSFAAYGAVYSIDIECFHHTSDPSCTEDQYAISIADELARANAKPTEKQDENI